MGGAALGERGCREGSPSTGRGKGSTASRERTLNDARKKRKGVTQADGATKSPGTGIRRRGVESEQEAAITKGAGYQSRKKEKKKLRGGAKKEKEKAIQNAGKTFFLTEKKKEENRPPDSGRRGGEPRGKNAL